MHAAATDAAVLGSSRDRSFGCQDNQPNDVAWGQVSCDKTYISRVQMREKQATLYDDSMEMLATAVETMQDD